MVKCTLDYFGVEMDISEDEATLNAVPLLRKFNLTVEKVDNGNFA